jgi:hypothetical protein
LSQLRSRKRTARETYMYMYILLGNIDDLFYYLADLYVLGIEYLSSVLNTTIRPSSSLLSSARY